MATCKNVIRSVAEKTGIAQKVVKEVMDAAEESVKTELIEIANKGSDEYVKVVDLRLYVNDMPAREMRNPRTGEAVEVPAKKRVVVKKSVDFKELLG